MRRCFENVPWAQDLNFREDFLKAAERREMLRSSVFIRESDVPVTLSGRTLERLGLIIRLAVVGNSDHLHEAAHPYEDVFRGPGQLKGVV